MNKIIITILLFVSLFVSSLSAQSLKEGHVLGESNLYKKPFSDAEVIVTLLPDSVVTVLRRKGGWYQVKTSKKVSGWMRMSSLKFGEQKVNNGAGNIQGLQQTISLFKTGRSGSSGVTVATGIRGLNAADLKNARPDQRALKQLSKYSSNRERSEKFAANARLKSQELAFFGAVSSNTAEPEKDYWK